MGARDFLAKKTAKTAVKVKYIRCSPELSKQIETAADENKVSQNELMIAAMEFFLESLK